MGLEPILPRRPEGSIPVTYRCVNCLSRDCRAGVEAYAAKGLKSGPALRTLLAYATSPESRKAVRLKSLKRVLPGLIVHGNGILNVVVKDLPLDRDALVWQEHRPQFLQVVR